VAGRNIALPLLLDQEDSISSKATSRSAHNVVEGDIDALVRARFFPDAGFKGVMVEVGAARPDFLSIGASFRDVGWRVLSIEPNPVFAAMHRELGHEIVQAACGEHDADDVPFFVVDSKQADYLGGSVTGESFSSLGIRGDYAKLMMGVDVDTTEILVAVRRLDSILEAATPNIERVDLICVDVEGWELEVLKGLSFERWRPKVVIAEHLFEGSEYQGFMRKRGYELWRCVTPNEVYVQAVDAPFIPRSLDEA
jgi:FkbM family methyltransferase